MSAQHTPGPWTASQYIDDGQWGVLTSAGGIVVSVRSTSVADGALTEADARLIAAAPNLLAACRMTTLMLGRLGGMLPGSAEAVRMVVDQSAAAIAQATGGHHP